jgi:hypothetical protein
VQREVNVLALIKGNERFIYIYDDTGQQPLIETFRDQAADPHLSFSWFDAAVKSPRTRSGERIARQEPVTFAHLMDLRQGSRS